MEEEGKKKGRRAPKMAIEDIGAVVKTSGFKYDQKVLESSIGLVKELESFMTIGEKTGETSEDRIKALQRDGVLSEKDAKEALKVAKNKAQDTKKAQGGVKYTEDQRYAINFSRTCVSHVHRLLTAIK